MIGRELRGKGLVLVGYRGTGKSTVGRILAARLGRSFVDSDVVLETQVGVPVRSIFEEHGEDHFRDLEERVLLDLTARPDHVIATGGGAILRESNRNVLRTYGLVVWLTATPEELGSRLAANRRQVLGRPALTTLGTLDEIATVLQARLPFYKEASDMEVSTEGRSASDVAQAIISRLTGTMLDPQGALT